MNKLIALTVSVLMAGAAFCGVTTHLSLDSRVGVRVADSLYPLVYDASWYAGGVTAKITDNNGQEIVSGVSGTYVWAPTTDGVHVLTLNVYNAAGNVIGTERAWYLSLGDTTELVIPEGLTEIGDDLFAGGQFTSVTIPSSVTRISTAALAGFDRLDVKFEGAKPTVVDENGARVDQDARREGVFGPYADVSSHVRVYYHQDKWGEVDTWCGVACRPLPDVTITPGGKYRFTDSVSVSISCPAADAVIHYTADGTEPTADSPVFRKLTVNRKATVKARAILTGCPFEGNVAVAQFGTGYTANPTISSSQGTTYYYWDNMISFSCSTPNVEYYYTLDGSDPVENGTKYTEPFPIAESLTVKVVAKHLGEYVDSDVVSKTFTRNRYTVATPQIKSGQGWPHTETVNTVTLTCSTTGATIYYSTGGGYAIYTEPFKISGETTVSAYAVKDDWTRSETAERTIPKTWFEGVAVGMPDQVFIAGGGNLWTTDTRTSYDGGSSLRSAEIGDDETSDLQTSVTGKGTISFHWKTSCECDPYFPGAFDHLRFCVDGTEEAVLDGETGWEAFSLHLDTDKSHVLKWEYVKDESASEGDDCGWVDAISFVPDPMAKIRFNGNESTSGELPTEITHYLGESVTLPGRGTLERTMYDFGGWSDGKDVYAAWSQYYPPDTDITLAAVWNPRVATTPSISVASTYAATSTKVYIYGSGRIYYTTDGTMPTESSKRYTGGFSVSGGTTVIKAIAFEDDRFPSAVASATTTCQWKSEKIGTVTWWYSAGEIVGVEGLSGKVVLPSTLGGQPVKKIGYSVFDDCRNLLAVVIPEGVEELDENAFEWCEDLQTVVLPSTLVRIRPHCFESCESLAQVYWCMMSEPTCEDRIYEAANESLVSHIPWTISTHLWNERTWAPWTPPANGATGMIKEVIGDYSLCAVTFNGNGGGVSETSRSVVSGEAVGTLPVPWRNGYEFAGWYTAASGGTQVTAATIVTKDVTYYAQWREIGGDGGSGGAGDEQQLSAPTVEIVEPEQAFVAPAQKAVKPGVVLAADGSVAGVVQLEVGKASKNGVSKVTVTIIGIDGKKAKSKAVQVATGAGLQRVTFDVKGYGALTLDIGADGFVGGTAGATVASVKEGAATGEATVAFSLVNGYSLAGLLTEYLPNGVKVTRTAKKWTLPKAGKLKYKKPNAAKGIPGGLTATGENISGLKLSYTAKTGVLKGSFKLWTLDTAKGKIKSVSAKVTGVVVNGVGYCEATVKNQKIGDLIVE